MSSKLHPLAAAFVAAFVVSFPLCAPARSPDPHSAIAWQVASSGAEVDRAFALARQTGKPVFLYWGAVWCPPCNQVKATLFSRPDFAERSKAFVPVYVDGDNPGAQKVAARFHVSGYPTMVLFKPDGSEITRLPGEVDPERYLLTLSAALNADVPVKELVARAVTHQPLSSEQWRLLGFYSWDTDDQQVFRKDELAARLSQLAAAVPGELGSVKDRLALKALSVRARDGTHRDEGRTVAADTELVERVLATPDAMRQQWDLMIYLADPATRYLAASAGARVELARKWDISLDRLLASGVLSRSDSVDALDARVSLWKIIDGSERLSASRQSAVRGLVLSIVSQTTDRYERQAVVPSAADVLASAGLLDESDQMLKAELPRAVAPYYHMLVLASNAKKRGDKVAALSWYETAWRKSEGPATRIQWGAGFVRQLIELTPQDSQRIASTIRELIGSLEPLGETFFERNERSLQRMAAQLVKWQGTERSRAQIVARAKEQLATTCGKVPPQEAGRANCLAVFGSVAKTQS